MGSFLNVCIYRLPLQQSIISPSSHCPRCNVPVKFYDNIPMLSFLLLQGKCRSCGNPISVQYILVEILNAAGYALILWRFGLSVESTIYAALFSSLLVASVIDLHHRIIPDVITIPGTIAGLLANAFILPGGIKGSVIGTLLGGGIFFIAAVASRGGMGGGDMKLGAMLGAFLGWRLLLVGVMISVLAGGVVAIALLALRRRGRKDAVPFGPFLALGGALALLWGERILQWYLTAFVR